MRAAESVTGVDIADEAIAEAKRVYSRGNLRFLKGNVEQLTAIPELGSPFDVAVNLEDLEHLNDPVRFLAELRLVLKQNGIFVVSSPNGQLTELDERESPKNPFHVKEFTEQELARRSVRTLARSSFMANGEHLINLPESRSKGGCSTFSVNCITVHRRAPEDSPARCLAGNCAAAGI